MFLNNSDHFYFVNFVIQLDDKDDKQDIRILNELENIDDELEKEGIVIVRIDNDDEAKEYGIDHLPTLIYFENKIPALYEGRIMIQFFFFCFFKKLLQEYIGINRFNI